MRARPFRLIRRTLAAVGILVMLFAAGLSGLLWLSTPARREELAVAGLSAPVDVTFDQDGVPRIHAETMRDAATALGFVHARDRMFEMEMMRRAASGRLSEIAGAATLPIDRQMRVLGLRVRALADLEALSAPTRAMLDAYAAGVNAWIALMGRFSAPEFILLGPPEPWQPVDCLLWGKTIGLWLSGNWRTELARLTLADKLSAKQRDELWPEDQSGAGRPYAQAGPPARSALLAGPPDAWLPRFPALFTMPATASNGWAIDGRHTATGAPLLAGDPHLQFAFPGIWYLARIDTMEGTLAGATAPGVPFLVLGHNGHVGWTFTTTGADVQDVFIETPAPDGGYQTPDGPRPFTVREERIGVRGAPDQVLRVRETRHGPVISDLSGTAGPVLAVAMANLAPGDTAAQGLFALNRARDVDEAGAAAALISSPVQNLIVADHARIALYVTGRVPLRRAGDGSAPVPGADGAHDWIGWASGDALPRYVAPQSGRLVNANERVAPGDFPVFLGRDWFGDWRARRIRAMLDASERHTAADFARMQTDVSSEFARQILPVLRRVAAPDPASARALALFADWDGAMAMDLPQPLLFNAWMFRFDDLVLAQNNVPRAAPGPMTEFLSFVLSPPGAHWCGGDCGPVLATALGETVAELAARFGADPAAWRWGAVHQAVFAHPMLHAIPLLGVLASPRIDSPGDDGTVDRGSPLRGSFESVHGASYRGVYDLADLDRSLFMVAPGQSGRPFERGARNFLTRWRDGSTITLGKRPDRVAATIHLTPQ
ncbi:MAG: penicillin acylase family protein [Alphaproteobacteria bacterium]|nr:penicillin acylase family protein [Alphaproteobacteria bacterium]